MKTRKGSLMGKVVFFVVAITIVALLTTNLYGSMDSLKNKIKKFESYVDFSEPALDTIPAPTEVEVPEDVLDYYTAFVDAMFDNTDMAEEQETRLIFMPSFSFDSKEFEVKDEDTGNTYSGSTKDFKDYDRYLLEIDYVSDKGLWVFILDTAKSQKYLLTSYKDKSSGYLSKQKLCIIPKLETNEAAHALENTIYNKDINSYERDNIINKNTVNSIVFALLQPQPELHYDKKPEEYSSPSLDQPLYFMGLQTKEATCFFPTVKKGLWSRDTYVDFEKVDGKLKFEGKGAIYSWIIPELKDYPFDNKKIIEIGD